MFPNRFRNTKKKYKNRKVEIDGHKFDSAAEAECYSLLKLMERNGEIKLLALQPKVYLTAARILYVADFLIDEKGRRVYIDVKGMRTTAFQIKKRLWRYYGDGTLRLVKKNGFGFDKIEEIESTGCLDSGGTNE